MTAPTPSHTAASGAGDMLLTWRDNNETEGRTEEIDGETSMGIVYSSLTLVPPNNYFAFVIFTGIGSTICGMRDLWLLLLLGGQSMWINIDLVGLVAA